MANELFRIESVSDRAIYILNFEIDNKSILLIKPQSFLVKSQVFFHELSNVQEKNVLWNFKKKEPYLI